MLYGLLNLSFWGYVIAVLIMTHITVMSVTLYLHRCQAHRGIDMHPIVSHFCRFWLWLTTGMETSNWVAIHRKHHARCETEEDPHSPQILGLKKVLLEGAELYRAAAKDKDMIAQFSHGCPQDWVERNVYTRFSRSGIALMFLIDLLLFGIPGITVWAVQMMWIPFFAAGVINGLGHFWGYRNFECPDAATNIVPLAILLGGEELHNNHHTFGSSAKFSVKKWEFDLGWLYIRALSSVGLAKVRKVAPKPHLEPSKTTIDVDTIKALLTNRFQVMASYSKRVISPVVNAERSTAAASAKQLLRHAKTLLSKEKSLVDEKGQQRLNSLLESNASLNVVYQYREKLQAIWDRTTASQKELVEAIQEWCRQAEATGIDALKEFATHIRHYAVKVV